MKIAVVHPSPVPFTRGGAERATTGIQAAINDLTQHEAEMIKIPVDERTLPGVIEAYETYANLNLDHFDRIIVSKYPAWMVDHPHKTLLMMHPLRGVYDTYQYHDQPLTVPNPSPDVFAMLHLMEQSQHRGSFAEFFERWHNALARLGPDHPDFVFPGPFARTAVRWLDGIAMAPGAVKRYLSQSNTVAVREGYFPRSVTPTIVHLPGHLPQAPRNEEYGSYLFTASRLDGPKRLDLLIDAMAHVPGPTQLRIAGTGALRAQLEVQAADDPRIRFLGFVRDDELPELYANALAAPFIPADEDLGLITLEAFSQGTAVVTCTDSGGPTEFIKDGTTGLVAEPTAASIGSALARLVADHGLAHQLGQAGKERGDRITWEGVVDAVLGEARLTPEERAAQGSDGAAPAAVVPASRRRVVVLTTFPINNPGHGGQLRARHLYGALARWRPVQVVALVDFGNQAEVQSLAPGLTQVVVPRSAAQHLAGEELSAEARMPVTDVTAGSHIELTPDYLAAVAEAIDGASAVILAEPYLLPALEQLGTDIPVIYDAFNVEAQLKAGIFPDTELGRDLLAQVVDVENRAVLRSARTTTCSSTDAVALAEGAGQAADRMAVIPNGTTVPAEIASPAERQDQSTRWRRRYWTAGSMGAEPEHVAVFFGSWHPPNLDAAELLIEIAPQLPNLVILSVGRHGQAFANRSIPENLVFPGVVSTRTKDRLLATADVALNPMRLGSGTNLKLLEYLAVGIPVVSTPFGARGIDVVDGEHLRFAEPQAFAAAVVEVLADPAGAQRRAEAARALVSARYSWDRLGAELASVVGEVVPTEARK
ncbi:glycosyltransferase family 4 protein [Aquihabitans sp. McL0605]|uniref:glycosyltransferase family 4 protein n=1 Tax=Aquihabitans sp. McL0605 TaxID=3415671 RepID=UPI003CF37B5D